MLTISIYNNQIPCIKAIKGTDYIEVHFKDGSTQTESGITDFSGYVLIDEKGNPVEFSEPEPDEITQLQLAIAELYEEVLSNG